MATNSNSDKYPADLQRSSAGRGSSLLQAGLRGCCIAFGAWHIYVALTGVPSPYAFRGGHLASAMFLAFAFIGLGASSRYARLAYGTLATLSLVSCGYVVAFEDLVSERFSGVDSLTVLQWASGVTAIALILEGTRKLLGAALPVTAVLLTTYALVFTNVTAEEMVDQLFLTTDGIFGIPVAVSATYLLLFIIFGAFIERSGAGQFFIDIATALTGRSSGGAAKAAVVTSGLFGAISGSAVSNVMSTGIFTIPLMKRLGYRPHFAAGVESVASCGGQIAPPVMGAAAFVMAEFLGISYLQVAVYAAIPALLYYIGVFVSVDLEARRLGLKPIPQAEVPAAGRVVRDGAHLVLPIVVLVGFMAFGYSASLSAVAAIICVFPVALLRSTTRQNVTVANIAEAVVSGVRAGVAIALACATAGIVMGAINLSGIGLDFTIFVVSISDGSMVATLLLTAIAGIVVGMGLPTTPAYIIQVALFAPALIKVGVELPAAHLFLLYFGTLSAITPPVAIAVFAANGIAGAGLWRSGLAAMKLGAAGYIIPFMFATSPELMLASGNALTVAAATVTAIFGVCLLASATIGYLLRSCRLWERGALAAAAVSLIGPGLWSDLFGLATFVVVGGLQFVEWRKETKQPETH